MLLDKGSGLQTHKTVSIHIVIILYLLRIVHMKPVLFENVILPKPLCSKAWKMYDMSLIHQAVAIYCMYTYYYGFRLKGSRKTIQKTPK